MVHLAAREVLVERASLKEEPMRLVQPYNLLVKSRDELIYRSSALITTLTHTYPNLENAIARINPVIARIGRVPLRLWALGLALAVETILLLLALVPPNVWADVGLPAGPIPPPLAPLVAGLFYALPSLTGLLTRRWQAAVVLATFPAWLDLGLFAVVAAARIGPYYLATEPHAVSTVGTLELFAALGALGWLARPLVFALGAVVVPAMGEIGKMKRRRRQEADAMTRNL